jgi:hypothetical protein
MLPGQDLPDTRLFRHQRCHRQTLFVTSGCVAVIVIALILYLHPVRWRAFDTR